MRVSETAAAPLLGDYDDTDYAGNQNQISSRVKHDNPLVISAMTHYRTLLYSPIPHHRRIQLNQTAKTTRFEVIGCNLINSHCAILSVAPFQSQGMHRRYFTFSTRRLDASGLAHKSADISRVCYCRRRKYGNGLTSVH